MTVAAGPAQALRSRLIRPNDNFHPELDFLRSVAVVFVVIDHTFLAHHREKVFGVSIGMLGLIGVWMFFVHTALVLMWSLERKPYTLDFYVRRAFRIYPLAWAAIAVACLTQAPVLGVSGAYFAYRHITLSNLLANIFLVMNMDPGAWGWHAIVHVLWTLPSEVQMYLVLPVLFAFVRREKTIWTLLLLWCFACAVAHTHRAAFPTFASTAPDFLGGVIAFLMYKRARPKFSAWLFPVFLFALTAIALRSQRLEVAWVFTLALGFGLPYFHSFKSPGFTRICHHLAKYSYGIYLIHPFALVLAVYFLPGRNIALQLAVEIVVIAVVTVAAYHLLEKPMIDWGSRLAARIELYSLARRGEGRNTL